MRKVLLALVALFPLWGSAADRPQIMLSRYLKYQFCMEKTFGQGFYKRLGLVPLINQWGVSEPAASSIAIAAEAVRKTDTECRIENQIEDQPRPDSRQ